MNHLLLALGAMFLQQTFIALGRALPAVIAPAIITDLRIDPAWSEGGAAGSGRAAEGSLSWRMVEYLIKHGRIGCVPGVDFGANGEGYVRFCFARDRQELAGALASMQAAMAGVSV